MPAPARDRGHPERRRPPVREWALLALALAVALGIAELGARAAGLRPWSPEPPAIRIEPPGPFTVPHPRLGYAYRPGRFRVTLPHGGVFTATHGPAGLRRTAPDAPAIARETRPQLWIFGGSFTYGWGVEDSESWPWRLQQHLPGWRVVNFGIGGYGTLAGLEQFREARGRGLAPRAVLVAYASFHDRRNTMGRQQAKAVVRSSPPGERHRPVARLDADGELVVEVREIGWREPPLVRHLVLAHALERLRSRWEESRADGRSVSLEILRRFAEAARARGARFAVAGLDPASAPLLRALSGEGLVNFDVSLDLSGPDLRLAPDDGHPNARAHALYAREVAARIGPWLAGGAGPP